MRPTKQASAYRLIISGVLLISLLISGAPAQARSSKSHLQRKNSTIQSRIRTVRKELRQVKRREAQTKRNLNGVEHRLRVARGELRVANLRLERSKIELLRANQALRDAKANFTVAQQNTGERLAAVYERGNPGYMDLLLSADDFGEMLQRAEIAEFLAQQDRDALNDLKAQKSRVSRYQHRVQQKTVEVSTWQQRVAVLHNRTAIERTSVARDLTSVRSERIQSEAELASLERESNAITAMLRRMQSSAAGRKRYRRTYSGPVSGLPTRGRISSSFGYRYHPIRHTRRLHTGVDIAAPTGTAVTSAGGGEVIYAGWRGGYGNTVIVDHGGGRATLYGHMSAILVHSGQTVRRGQQIGRVGSTGLSTGPHLHYELRINGSPVNPL